MKTLCSLKIMENGYAQDKLTTAVVEYVCVCEGTIKIKIKLN